MTVIINGLIHPFICGEPSTWISKKIYRFERPLMENKKTLLWVDDIRNPYKDLKWLGGYAPEFYYHDGDDRFEVIWLKNYDEFTSWIEQNGLPTKIAFDHDLGNVLDRLPFGIRHIAIGFCKLFRIEPKPLKTGYDACHWLKDYCLDNDLRLTTEFVYQTDNTVGKENMSKLINNFKKFQNKEFKK